MFDELISLLDENLKNNRILFWRVVESLEKQREFYTLGERLNEKASHKTRAVLDQGRIVNQSQIQIEVWVEKGELQGFSSKSIFPGRPLIEQLNQCIEQAQVSSEKPWAPPAPSQPARRRFARSSKARPIHRPIVCR